MRSPGEFLCGEFLKDKYTHQLSTEYPPELRRVPGPIESTDFKNTANRFNVKKSQFNIDFWND